MHHIASKSWLETSLVNFLFDGNEGNLQNTKLSLSLYFTSDEIPKNSSIGHEIKVCIKVSK